MCVGVWCGVCGVVCVCGVWVYGVVCVCVGGRCEGVCVCVRMCI